MERLTEVNHLSAEFPATGGAVAFDFPVESRLERILDCQSAASDEEEMLEGRRHGQARERVDEGGVLGRIHIGVGGIGDRRAL